MAQQKGKKTMKEKTVIKAFTKLLRSQIKKNNGRCKSYLEKHLINGANALKLVDYNENEFEKKYDIAFEQYKNKNKNISKDELNQATFYIFHNLAAGLF